MKKEYAIGIALLVALAIIIAVVMYRRDHDMRHTQHPHPHPPHRRYNPLPHRPHRGEKFAGEDWPQAGTFGATGDTFPYGNYADGLQMYYPTLQDRQY